MVRQFQRMPLLGGAIPIRVAPLANLVAVDLQVADLTTVDLRVGCLATVDLPVGCLATVDLPVGCLAMDGLPVAARDCSCSHHFPGPHFRLVEERPRDVADPCSTHVN